MLSNVVLLRDRFSLTFTKTCFCPTLTNVLHNFPRSSGQEKDEKDNNATISVFVNREVIMDITGYNINLTTVVDSIFLS